MKYFYKQILFRIGISFLVPVLLMVSDLHSQQEHKKIVEEVSVSWWQIPVFAVDKPGNSVTDLKPTDIEIKLNGRKISSFVLNKRSFSVTKRGKARTVETPAVKELPIKKNKVLFFMFDQALSGQTSTRRAKNIAQKIVMDAQEEVRFFVLTVDAFAGLKYVGSGSGSNKDQLVKLIEKEVKEKINKRIADPADIMANVQAPRTGERKYDEEEILLYEEAISKYYKRKTMGFLYSFETLYFFLNSIEDNKFIYFFSEGMSESIVTSNRSLAGNRGMYYYYFKRMAKYLSRCGAVLLIINTMGVDQYHSRIALNSTTENSAETISELPGEDSLHLLAKQSGGTYLEGTQEKIVEQLENMGRAYYEIAFPDIPQLKGETRKISIKSKRKGIKIYSLRTLEKRKHYKQMNPVEKEMLVLNLITQPQNTLIKGKINAYNARVNKTKKRCDLHRNTSPRICTSTYRSI